MLPCTIPQDLWCSTWEDGVAISAVPYRLGGCHVSKSVGEQSLRDQAASIQSYCECQARGKFQSLQRHPSACRQPTPTSTPNLVELGLKIKAQYTGVSPLLPPCQVPGIRCTHALTLASMHVPSMSYLTHVPLKSCLTGPFPCIFKLWTHVLNKEFTSYHTHTHTPYPF